MGWYKRNKHRINLWLALVLVVVGIVLCATGRFYGITPIFVGVILGIQTLTRREKEQSHD